MTSKIVYEKEIPGWTVVFMITLLLSAGMNVVTGLILLLLGFAVHPLLFLMLIPTGGHLWLVYKTFLPLLKKTENAITWTKIYLGIKIAMAIFGILIGIFTTSNLSEYGAFGGIIFAVTLIMPTAWWLYFTKSKKVLDVYGGNNDTHT
tara:strand:- start:1725 stop:2168 length:444 start_codon:yes stop_codon:yes gene_type:complete